MYSITFKPTHYELIPMYITQILTAYEWGSTKYIVRFLLSHKFRQLIFVLYHDITCGVGFRQQDGKNYPMAQITEIMIQYAVAWLNGDRVRLGLRATSVIGLTIVHMVLNDI